jgi:hypothetical protein
VGTDERLLGGVLGLGQASSAAQRQHDRGKSVIQPGKGFVVAGPGGSQI